MEQTVGNVQPVSIIEVDEKYCVSYILELLQGSHFPASGFILHAWVNSCIDVTPYNRKTVFVFIEFRLQFFVDKVFELCVAFWVRNIDNYQA